MDVVLIPDPKAPGEDGVYSLDYFVALAGDTIAASAWDVPAGITKVADVFADHATTITVAGGTDGADYLLTNTVTSAGGLTLQGFVTLRVRQPGAQPAPVATRYAALADMVARFGHRALVELTDTGDIATGQIDQAKVAQALADADATVDGYLASRYTLPLATVPELLKVIACDIARYRLMGERPIEEVRQRFEDARQWLAAVAAGKFGLGMDDSGNAVPEGDDGPFHRGDRRVFDKRRLHDYLHPPVGGMFY
jgi:phage gp36-like protein